MPNVPYKFVHNLDQAGNSREDARNLGNITGWGDDKRTVVKDHVGAPALESDFYKFKTDNYARVLQLAVRTGHDGTDAGPLDGNVRMRLLDKDGKIVHPKSVVSGKNSDGVIRSHYLKETPWASYDLKPNSEYLVKVEPSEKVDKTNYYLVVNAKERSVSVEEILNRFPGLHFSTVESVATNKALDAGGKNNSVYPHPSPNSANNYHQWGFYKVGDYYMLINKATGKALDGGGGDNGDMPYGYPNPKPTNNPYQLWKVTKNGSGYQIVNKATGRALDSGGDNGNKLYMYPNPIAGNRYHQWQVNLPDGTESNSAINNFINWAMAQTSTITRHDRLSLGTWSDGECVTLIARYIQDVFMNPADRSRPGQAYNHGYGTASTVSNLPYFGSYTTRGSINSNPPRRGGVISFMGSGFDATYGHVGIVTRYDATANRIYYIDIGKSQGGVVKGEKSISASSSAIRGWTNPNVSAISGGGNSTPADIASQTGLKFIAKHEGLRQNLYNDPAGHCTIGVGHLVHYGNCNGSESAEFRNGISEQRAYELLRSDVNVAVQAVKSFVKVPLNQQQFDALVSFTFNLGSGNLQKSDLLKRLNAGEYDAVPYELSRWVYGGGVKLPGLVRRRNEEGILFRDGIYTGV
jgi:GH24 family phage-related lysozyme (muramidase)